MNTTSKVSDISKAITEAIAELCQCQYTRSFIADSQLFCNGKGEVVYQGQLLTTDDKTAEEIRNLTQEWVLNKPFISVSNQTYQLNAYCSVTIDKVGKSVCNTISSTEPTLKSNELSGTHGYTIREESFIIVVALLVLIIVAFAVSATAYFIRRRSKMRRLKLRYHTV